MNIQEVQALTDDEIRCKVGELQGWRRDVTTEAEFNESRIRNIWVDPKGKRFIYGLNYPPNYPADLNACHEAEEAWFRSNPNPVWKYSTNLEQIVERDWEAGMPDLDSVCFYRATARQRCEALILTLTQP